eukprot:scaffold2754_cov149-Skeletonema_menzelii.AAC.7
MLTPNPPRFLTAGGEQIFGGLSPLLHRMRYLKFATSRPSKRSLVCGDHHRVPVPRSLVCHGATTAEASRLIKYYLAAVVDHIHGEKAFCSRLFP